MRAAVVLAMPLAAALQTVETLGKRAQALRKTWNLRAPPSEPDFFFDSVFQGGEPETGSAGPRSFSNWLVPGKIMLGQYPHRQPAVPGPSAAECEAHVRALVGGARVRTFVQLQAELPPQDDVNAWPAGGVRLPDARDRARFPAAFENYAASAGADVAYLHSPIVDLDVPDDGALVAALDGVLSRLEAAPGDAVYVHCWGGRGRAGTVGACALSLLFPELDGDEVLDVVQAAYSSRLGASTMPGQLKRSPQTEAQRDFVRAFVGRVRARPPTKERTWPKWQDDLPSGGL